MKTYKYWKRVTEEITAPGGERVKITGLGRSNSSEIEAASDARVRLRKVEAKIAGEEPELEDYSADIKEEVVKELDPKNIVTRNRYGALVLNSESVTMIDVDQHHKGFLEFFGFKKRENKAAIIEDLEKVALDPEYANLGFRLYETSKGVRVIITGAYLDPKDIGWNLMRACYSDPLFRTLCMKQNCYRARLTPKPHRLKLKAIKYKWPLEGEELEAARLWIKEYDERSENYAICRHIKNLGRKALTGLIVQFHDEETRAFSGLPLA
ncbi:MAG: hypothetical protein PHV36_07000 [Elusimicrobiales bacterium]|nr:hypothetical protein [Elusimicrobiales bacterium]